MAEIKTAEPLEVKVDPQKWTTKVNIALVVGVLVVLLSGFGYAIYAALHPEQVQQESHEEVTRP